LGFYIHISREDREETEGGDWQIFQTMLSSFFSFDLLFVCFFCFFLPERIIGPSSYSLYNSHCEALRYKRERVMLLVRDGRSVKIFSNYFEGENYWAARISFCLLNLRYNWTWREGGTNFKVRFKSYSESHKTLVKKKERVFSWCHNTRAASVASCCCRKTCKKEI
jgi:hypothetical protein